MNLEVLEDRLVPTFPAAPINIYVHNVADGAINNSLTHLTGNNYTAPNLRSAIDDVNHIAGSNTIILDSKTYLLNSEIGISLSSAASKLTIRNTSGGANSSTIDVQQNDRIFDVNSNGTVTLDHLTLQHGTLAPKVGGDAEGGAIFNRGNLKLSYDVLKDNTANAYGGPFVNWGKGGAIYNNSGASLDIRYTTFDANVAETRETNSFTAGGAEGGAIYLGSGSGAVTILASTFSNNHAFGANNVGGEGNGGSAFGGAMSTGGNVSVNVDIRNTTFANNAAYGGSAYGGNGGNAYGGALNAFNSSTNFAYTFVNDTFAFNQADPGAAQNTEIGSNGFAQGGAINNFGPPATVRVVNTIIAQNTANGGADDVAGSFTSLGHNLLSTAPPDFDNTGDLTNTDPNFDPTGLTTQYGGSTATISPLPSSPAINGGDNSAAVDINHNPLAYDQRGPGFPRKMNGTVDIGAVELQMDLNKFYTLKSSRLKVTNINVAAPGLLAGVNSPILPPLPQGDFYQIAVDGEVTWADKYHLIVNPDGSFSLTVPPGFTGTLVFQFRIYVQTPLRGPLNGPISFAPPLGSPTPLVFTATLKISGGSFGRGSAGTYLGL
jgi:hypothetical protein